MPSQASPASRRHSPGESRRGGGPERQPTRQAAGEPQAGLLPTLYRPTEDGRPSHGLSWWAAPSTLPPGPGCGRARATGEYGAVSPAPSLRVRGPGKRRASSPAPAPITTPTPVQDRYSAPPSSSRIASGASHPRAHHVCALGAAAPASGKAGRRPGCEARPQDPYLGGDCPPVLLRAGLLEASPTWQGMVSKFPAASPWERHRGSSQAGANLGPAPVLLDRRGTQAGFFFFFSYAKAQAPPQRPRSYQEPSANYHSKSTRLLLPCARHSEALVLLLSGRPPLQALLPGMSALQPTQPRRKVKARRDAQSRTKVALLSPAQEPAAGTFPMAGTQFFLLPQQREALQIDHSPAPEAQECGLCLF